jgi:Zn-dependent protease with chaperone function
MNFFQAQDTARRKTFWLVVLFLPAVIALIAITNLLVLAVLAYKHSGVFASNWSELVAVFDPQLTWIIAVGIILIIASGSWYKTSMLSSGGRAVAESLGGRLIAQNSRDPVHRKILNVVEEMAIASGTPVPQVYLLDEMSINAFAAGWSPGTAVIGITRGAVTYLNRDELQGVIAHEFSHIFNGDMRLNIRLIGVLNGILLLGLIGYYMLRSVRYIGRSRNREGGNAALAIVILGLGLTIIGYCGTFFGQWIKAMVSRQREYLADATAVQYTRNKDGIAGALKKIGGLNLGSKLLAPTAPEYSHAYFSNGVSSFLSFLFATHPPLEDRVRRLQPGWNGRFIIPQPDPTLEPAQREEKTIDKKAAGIAVTAAVNEAMTAIQNAGNPSDAQVTYAKELLKELPNEIIDHAEDPYAARALIYCLLLHKDTALRSRQTEQLRKNADENVLAITHKLHEQLNAIPIKFRLPIIALCFPALRTLSREQYRVFRKNTIELLRTDEKIDIGEWIVKRLVLNKLDEAHNIRKPAAPKFGYIGAVKKDFEYVLSFFANAEHADDSMAEAAFNAGKRAIGAGALNRMPRDTLSISRLDKAMDKLEQVMPLIKPRILKAIAACIAHDELVTNAEAELLRTVALTLDSPMPPVAHLAS